MAVESILGGDEPAAGDGAFSTLQRLAPAYFAARCLHVAAEIGVADALDDQPTPFASLAARTGTDPDALARIVRLLESHGVFVIDRGLVGHTPASRLLKSDHPQGMRDFARMFGLPFFWQSAEQLLHSVRTGRAAAPTVFEDGLWGWLAANPEEARVFDAAMSAKAMSQIGPIIDSYDFMQHRQIVDVGGGQGHLLRATLRACPGAKGTLFDLPHVIEAARAGGDEDGRLAFQGGDFFADSLPCADAYILMEVIHDWPDAQAAQILGAIRRSAPDGAKLILIETEIPDSRAPGWPKTLDIVMMTLFAARQRTTAEYGALLQSEGFELVSAVETGAGITLYEAR